jgi:peptidoglycan/xylan/chitin deacetylase (PgdA/CDA1 family)
MMPVFRRGPAVAALAASLFAAAPLPGQAPFAWPESKRAAISLSFDDGRASQIRNGLPLFRKYGVKATFYVTPAAVEKGVNDWKRAAADGHEIGNHTVSHPCTANYAFALKNPLEDYDVARMESELDRTDAEVERMLGVKPATFAYACGQAFIGRGLEAKSYVPLVARRFVVGRLYLSEAANDPAVCDLANAMGVGFDGLDFDQMISLVTQAAAQGRWLIFVGHDIGNRARQTTDAAALEELLKYAKDPAHGLWIDTVESIGRYVRQSQSRSGRR